MKLFGFCLEADEVVENLSVQYDSAGTAASFWLKTNRYDRLIAKASSSGDLLVVLALLAKQGIADQAWVVRLWRLAVENYASNPKVSETVEEELRAFIFEAA